MSDSDRRPEVSDREVLTVFAEMDGPLYVWEVADELPVTADELRQHFDDMEERGLIESDRDFAPGTVWRVPDDVDAEPDDEEMVTDTEAQAVDTGTETGARDVETTNDPPAKAQGEDILEYDPPTDAIEAFDPPGTPEQTEQRREAVRHAYGYLRERGRADREELVEAVFPAAPGAYESPDDGWWEEVVSPGLGSIPGVERTGDEAFAYEGRGEFSPA